MRETQELQPPVIVQIVLLAVVFVLDLLPFVAAQRLRKRNDRVYGRHGAEAARAVPKVFQVG